MPNFNIFNRQTQLKKSKRKENLQKILTMIDDINRSGNDVKMWHTKHNVLISTCIELTQGLSVDEKKIVQVIIDKCRY